jgi:RNA polymerase sigma-70 factor (ECF subfamily)
VNQLTDEQLVERLQGGQAGALDQLYARYAKKLHVFCSYNARSDRLDPEDLVQDVFLRVIKSAHTFDPGKASFRTWLFRIARNRCIDANRRERIIRFIPIGRKPERAGSQDQLEVEDALVDQSADVASSVMRASVVQAVRDCIEELDHQDEKQAIVLYYLGDKVYREIGDVLGKSTSMARNRVKAAQDKVRRCLERKGINAVSY